MAKSYYESIAKEMDDKCTSGEWSQGDDFFQFLKDKSITSEYLDDMMKNIEYGSLNIGICKCFLSKIHAGESYSSIDPDKVVTDYFNTKDLKDASNKWNGFKQKISQNYIKYLRESSPTQFSWKNRFTDKNYKHIFLPVQLKRVSPNLLGNIFDEEGKLIPLDVLENLSNPFSAEEYKEKMDKKSNIGQHIIFEDLYKIGSLHKEAIWPFKPIGEAIGGTIGRFLSGGRRRRSEKSRKDIIKIFDACIQGVIRLAGEVDNILTSKLSAKGSVSGGGSIDPHCSSCLKPCATHRTSGSPVSSCKDCGNGAGPACRNHRSDPDPYCSDCLAVSRPCSTHSKSTPTEEQLSSIKGILGNLKTKSESVLEDLKNFKNYKGDLADSQANIEDYTSLLDNIILNPNFSSLYSNCTGSNYTSSQIATISQDVYDKLTSPRIVDAIDDAVNKQSGSSASDGIFNQNKRKNKKSANYNASDVLLSSKDQKTMKKKADKFSNKYYRDASSGLDDETAKSYFTGLKSMYGKKPKKTKADYKKLYELHDESGPDMIGSAHPKTIDIAEAMGNGGIFENQIEQQRHNIGVAQSMPSGNFQGKHAWVIHNLVKLAEQADRAGDLETSDLIDAALEELRKI